MNRALAFVASLLAPVLFAGSAEATFAGRFLDPTFGSAGTASIPVTGSVFYVTAMAQARSGALMYTYMTTLDPRGGPMRYRLGRLTPGGVPDPGFGAEGFWDVTRVETGPEAEFWPGALLEDRSGRWVLAGLLNPPSSGLRPLGISRRLADGSLDGGFGQGGLMRWAPPRAESTNPCAGEVVVKGVAERTDGRLIVFGTRILMSDFGGITAAECMFVAQFTAGGALDTSFGNGGVVENAFQGKARLVTGKLLPDGVFEMTGLSGGPNAILGNGSLARWVIGPRGETLSSNAAPAPAYNGGIFAQPGGLFLGVKYEGPGLMLDVRVVTLEYRDSAGARVPTAGSDGGLRAEARGFGYSFVAITPDGGVVAKGMVPEYMADSRLLYRHFLCVWRADGRLEACEAIAPPGNYNTSHDYLAPDGSLYVADNASFAIAATQRVGTIGRFKVTAPVVEYFNDTLGHYFATYDGAEARGIDAGAAGPGWRRTGLSFASGGSKPVCRFYGTPGVGPNSHFYTIDPEECEAVKRDPGWTFEGLGFYATPAVGGMCASPLRPVQRLYNNRAAQRDSNHRYVTDPSLIPAMTASGWIHEGVVFCVRPVQG